MRNNTNNDNQINLNYLRIKNIPEINNENIEYCCICMENMIINDCVLEMPCKHIYHKDCIEEYLKNYRTKQKMLSLKYQYESEIGETFTQFKKRLHL